MEQAIDEASKKMAEILSDSRASHTGVKLEVNEKLIDSCTTLMNAIRLLVQRAKHLQTEIVAQGKVHRSVLSLNFFITPILLQTLNIYSTLISVDALRVQLLIKNSTKGIINGLRVSYQQRKL